MRESQAMNNRLDNFDLQNVTCHICNNSSSQKRIATRGQFGLPTYVSICQGCGLVFLSPRWSEKCYLDFYNNEYDKYYRSDIYSEQKQLSLKKKAKQITERLESSTYLIPTHLSILDVGCGSGLILDYLQQRYSKSEIYGIEASQKCCNYFQEHINGQLIAKDVNSNWHLHHKDRFDLIVMRHTLEHFLDPISILKKVTYALKPKGFIYIAVPDMLNPKIPLLDYWFRIVHIYYFSLETLERTAALAGLYPVSTGSEGHEVWGLFQKGDNHRKFKSVYKRQLLKIRKVKFQEQKSSVKALIKKFKHKVLAYLGNLKS